LRGKHQQDKENLKQMCDEKWYLSQMWPYEKKSNALNSLLILTPLRNRKNPINLF
jgi:hypothetical protein